MWRSLQRLVACLTAGFVGLLMAADGMAAQVTIDFELGALGGNRYEYRYTVTNVALATPVSWFSVDFDPALFDEASLTISSAGPGNWTQQLLGSLPGYPALFDAYLGSGAGLGVGQSASGFAVQFSWLGVAPPGSQAFTVYDAATLATLEVGRTTALAAPPTGVPEPSSVALVALALGAVVAVRRHARQTAAIRRT